MATWSSGWVEKKKKAFSFHQISLLHKIFPCRADKTRGEEGEKRRRRTRRGGNGGSEKLRIRRSTTWQWPLTWWWVVVTGLHDWIFIFPTSFSFDYWPKCPFFSAKSSVTHYWPVFKALHLNGVPIPTHGLVQ